MAVSSEQSGLNNVGPKAAGNGDITELEHAGNRDIPEPGDATHGDVQEHDRKSYANSDFRSLPGESQGSL